MVYSIKKLDQAQLAKIQDLERKLGCCIVAWEQPPPPADITVSQVEELKALEKETGTLLVAYRCQPGPVATK